MINTLTVVPIIIALTSPHPVIIQKDFVDSSSSIMVSKSPREYQCRTGAMFNPSEERKLQPRIPGATVDAEYCYVPISAGKCKAMKPFFNFGANTPSGMDKCNPSKITITDEATGKKYYRFNGGDSFILE